MTHTNVIDAASVRAEPESPIVLSVSKKAQRGTDVLTAIERAVLHRLASGHTNAQIGRHFGRSEKTVRNQLTRIYAKLGVTNRAAAAAVIIRMEFASGTRDAK